MRFAAIQLSRSLRRRLPRYFPALVALAVAAAAVGALGSISSDVGRKMRREFRRRGANAVARSRGRDPIPAPAVSRLEANPAVVASLPVRVFDARVGARRLVAAAFDFPRARRFASSWRIRGSWPSSPAEALTGERLADRMGWKTGQEVTLLVGDSPLRLQLTGRVSTGEGEDDEVLFSSGALPDAGGGTADAVLLRLSGSGSEVAREAAALERGGGLRVDPILAVAFSEGRVVEKLKGLLAAISAGVALLAGLGTGTTLAASVAQRRREIALQKSLGARPGRLMAQFLAEGASIGVAGGFAGAGLGLAAAALLERELFGVGLTVSALWILVPTLLAAALAAVSSIPAARRILRIEPITALREE
jgi:putative ABC transport system permease protein